MTEDFKYPRQPRAPVEKVNDLEDADLRYILRWIIDMLDKLSRQGYSIAKYIRGTGLSRAQITAIGSSTMTATLLDHKSTPSVTVNVRHNGSNALSGDDVMPKMAVDDIIDIYKAADDNWYWPELIEDHWLTQR